MPKLLLKVLGHYLDGLASAVGNHTHVATDQTILPGDRIYYRSGHVDPPFPCWASKGTGHPEVCYQTAGCWSLPPAVELNGIYLEMDRKDGQR